MNIILTGATGTLGSRILYELLPLPVKRIYLLVRPKSGRSSVDRVRNVLSSQYAPDHVRSNIPAGMQKIRAIDFSTMPSPATFLPDNSPTYFIHSAGFVNLSIDPQSRAEVFQENLLLTQQLFEAFGPYISKFVYVSTAFSAGDVAGSLEDHYPRSPHTAYRNHYEEAKRLTEIYLTEAGQRCNVPVQILRPSVLGGNILDQPKYFIAKYMVFYLLAKFFCNTTSRDTVRITLNTDAVLNVVPTDYAAKVVARVFRMNIQQLNIVHSRGTNVATGIVKILNTVGFKGYRLTDQTIASHEYKSKLERFYYQTIGVHLAPYLCSRPHKWSTSRLESILPLPLYNLEDYLANTVEFAQAHNFRSERW